MKSQFAVQFNSSSDHRVIQAVFSAAHGLKTSVKLAINFLTLNLFDRYRSASAYIYCHIYLYSAFYLY